MRSLTVLALLLIAAPAGADSIGITIVETTYSTDLTARVIDLTTNPLNDLTRARTIVAHDPLSDSVATSSVHGSSSTAEGRAELFSTWTHTASHALPGDTAAAFAGVAEQIAFTVASDAIGDLGLEVTGPFPNTVGSIRLTDLTTSLLLWNYMWHETTGTIPWASSSSSLVEWSVPTAFVADHLYRLEMSTFTSSLQDEQVVGMTVSGLKPVPEPSTLALLLLGGGVLYGRRSTGRRSARS